jgi:Cytochrome P460
VHDLQNLRPIGENMDKIADSPSRNHQVVSRVAVIGCVCIVALFAFWSSGHSNAQPQTKEPSTSNASFAADGELHLPSSFRRWEHVGSRVKTSGKSVLDGAVILRPQVMDTYVEPSAFVQYKKTGVWPDGTQIVKEISIIKIGDDCDKVTFACSTPAGAGIFEDSFVGIGMMVKDSKRFPNAPGNWAYFRFLANGSAYATSSAILAANQCQSCHVKFASKEDYVFTDTHIGLTSNNVH